MLNLIKRYYTEFAITLFIISIITLIVSMFYAMICYYDEQDRQLKECYFQEIKTKDCAYKLWKYENRDKSTHTTTTIPMYVYR